MKKIKLELERLAVESFDTASAADERGTVLGHQLDTYKTCPDPSWIDACPSERTCPTACSFTEC